LVEALGRGGRGIEKCLYQENNAYSGKVETVRAVEVFFYNRKRDNVKLYKDENGGSFRKP
jgi:hypothetical protein